MWCEHSQIAKLSTCINTIFLIQALLLGPIGWLQLTQWTLLDQTWVLQIMMPVQYWKELSGRSILQRVPYGLSLFHCTKVLTMTNNFDNLNTKNALLTMQFLYIVPYLGCWGQTAIEAGVSQGLQLLSLNKSKLLIFQDGLRTIFKYSTNLVIIIVLLW